MNKNRLEAFSDGVLAIIITIMVLEFKIPESAEWTSLQALIPKIISYFLSFFFVAVYWGNHHHLLHSVKNVSASIIWANMNFLFWLSLTPFVTGWMGSNHFAANTVAAYGIVLSLCGVAYYILYMGVQKNAHESEELKEAFVLQGKKGLPSLIGNMLGTIAAFFYPYIALAIYFIVLIMWVIPDKNIEKALKN